MKHSMAFVRHCAAAIAVGLSLVGLLSTALGQDRAAPQSDGQDLYVEYGCSGCHGYEAQGTVSAPPVPRLAPTAYPYEAFAVFVRTPPRVMPAYSPNVLSEEQLRKIFDYVRSIPEPPAVEDIPALRNLL